MDRILQIERPFLVSNLRGWHVDLLAMSNALSPADFREYIELSRAHRTTHHTEDFTMQKLIYNGVEIEFGDECQVLIKDGSVTIRAKPAFELQQWHWWNQPLWSQPIGQPLPSPQLVPYSPDVVPCGPSQVPHWSTPVNPSTLPSVICESGSELRTTGFVQPVEMTADGVVHVADISGNTEYKLTTSRPHLYRRT